MGEPPGFKLFKLFNSRAQLNNLNNLNPGGGPRGGVRDPPRELNNLNPGGSPVFKLFKLFNSRPRASPRTPSPGFKLFKLFNSRPQLNNLNTGRPPDLNYLIPGVQTHWNTIWGLFGSWRVESCQHTHIQLPNRPGLSHTRGGGRGGAVGAALTRPKYLLFAFAGLMLLRPPFSYLLFAFSGSWDESGFYLVATFFLPEILPFFYLFST